MSLYGACTRTPEISLRSSEGAQACLEDGHRVSCHVLWPNQKVIDEEMDTGTTLAHVKVFTGRYSHQHQHQQHNHTSHIAHTHITKYIHRYKSTDIDIYAYKSPGRFS